MVTDSDVNSSMYMYVTSTCRVNPGALSKNVENKTVSMIVSLYILCNVRYFLEYRTRTILYGCSVRSDAENNNYSVKLTRIRFNQFNYISKHKKCIEFKRRIVIGCY